MNIKRVITVIIIAVLLNIIFLPKAFALSDIIKNGDDFLGASTETIIKEDNLKTTSSKIYNILLGIGIAVAVIIGAVLGIQFIFGSVEGKAKISEALVPYIVGCAVVFGAFGIWKIAVNTGKQLVPQTSNAKSKDYGVVVCTTPGCGKTTTLNSSTYQQLVVKKKSIKLDCGHIHGPSDLSVQLTQ